MSKHQSVGARPTSVMRLAASVLFELLLWGAIYCEIVIVRSALRSTTTFAWREVPAIMLESRAQVEGLHMQHTLHVRYEYQFNGVVYQSRNYGWTGAPHHTDFAFDLAGENPAGAKVRCFVNPKLPTDAALVRGNVFGWVLVLFPPLFAYAAVRGLVTVWRR